MCEDSGHWGEKYSSCLINTGYFDIDFLHELCFFNHNSTSELDHMDHEFINDTVAMNRDLPKFLRKVAERILRTQKGCDWDFGGMSETEAVPGMIFSWAPLSHSYGSSASFIALLSSCLWVASRYTWHLLPHCFCSPMAHVTVPLYYWINASRGGIWWAQLIFLSWPIPYVITYTVVWLPWDWYILPI